MMEEVKRPHEAWGDALQAYLLYYQSHFQCSTLDSRNKTKQKQLTVKMEHQQTGVQKPISLANSAHFNNQVPGLSFSNRE